MLPSFVNKLYKYRFVIYIGISITFVILSLLNVGTHVKYIITMYTYIFRFLRQYLTVSRAYS